MNNKSTTYEEKMKDRDNEFLYDKCVKQYNVLMEYQHKMSDYKQQIETLEEENKTLKELNVCVGCDNNPDYKSRIDKAIEYIETTETYDDVVGYYLIKDSDIREELQELEKILKGEE